MYYTKKNYISTIEIFRLFLRSIHILIIENDTNHIPKIESEAPNRPKPNTKITKISHEYIKFEKK